MAANKGLRKSLDKMTYDKPQFNKAILKLSKSFKEAQQVLEGKKKKK